MAKDLVIYKTLDEIPIYNYVQCVNGDYRYMAKKFFKVESDDMQMHFINMLQESSGIRDKASEDITCRLHELEVMRKYLEMARYLNFYVVLAESGKLSDENKKEILDRRNAFENDASYWGMSLEEERNMAMVENAIAKVDKLREANSGKATTLEQLFNDAAVMSKVLGYHIDVKTISVTQYRADSNIVKQMTSK